jgi:putative transposase
LTAILDLADRKVIGWSLSDNLKTSATSIAAWRMAIKNGPLDRNLLFHSDRGIQYASAEFRAQFKGQSVLQSMSRKGNSLDNAGHPMPLRKVSLKR